MKTKGRLQGQSRALRGSYRRAIGRGGLALLPNALLFLCWSWLPPILRMTPAAFFYPVQIFASWYGGLVPGIISAFACTLFTVFSIRPHLLAPSLGDTPALVRTAMFLVTGVFFSAIISQLRKTTRRALRGHQHLRLALDSASIGSWEWDARSQRLKCDARALSCLGDESHDPYVSLGVVEGKLAQALLPQLRDQVSGFISRREDFHLEFPVTRSDGKEHWLSVSGRAMGAKGVSPAQVLGTISDITQRKDMENALRAAIRVRDDFLSIASHELKTPVTALKLQFDLIKRRLAEVDLATPNGAPLVRFLVGADRQFARLRGLMDDLLDATRISTGQLKLHPESLDFSALIADAVERFTTQNADRNMALGVAIEPRIHAKWDPLWMEQVVENLLSNAVKYGAGSPISLRFSQQEGKALLAVKDSGIGIDSAYHHKIFQRFERAHQGHSPSGLGLGLYICREVIGAHGGTITVESALGAGATFHVTLPLTAVHAYVTVPHS